MNTKQDRSQFTLDISQSTTHISPGHVSQKGVKKPIQWFFIGAAGQIGFAILIPLLLGVGIGIFIDQKFGSKPSGVLAGMVTGLVLSVINLFRTVQAIIKESVKN